MLTEILFYVFAAVAIFAALMTVSRKNPVASAIWLIGTFFALAAIFTLLGAYFIGVVQILVYAGAIMVLFLFVIMLLNLGNEYESDVRSAGWKVVAGGSGLVLVAMLARIFTTEAPALDPGADAVAAAVEEFGAVGAIAIPMYGEYMVVLQVTGILLLVAVIGAVILAKQKV